jgi:hypothetical protein
MPTARRSSAERLAVLAIVLAAVLPYVPSLDNYFVRDDFGVVQLLAQKPASYFPQWFYTSWMDRIWGFTADEIRPFPAVSYQLTALGGAASPYLHHALNILIHAANGLLVMAIARRAASLSAAGAALAGVLFVILPVHAESVAWITGRVDSMPAFFYLASFLAYVEWRRGGSRSPWLYGWSLLLFFVALFTKQNTVTMVATIALYDLIVLRRRMLPIVRFALAYVPFALLTIGYLWLRYFLFGEVAREGALNERALIAFAGMLERHVAHVVAGSPAAPRALVVPALAGIAGVWLLTRRRSSAAAADAGALPLSRVLVYFGVVWWTLGVAPVIVAGYSSPRHVYLAAVGWAIVVAAAFDVLAQMARSQPARRSVIAGAAAVVLLYTIPLASAVREWEEMADVAERAVQDVEREALAAPAGTLLLVGAPTRSWEWALPFAVRPPFTRADLTERVFIISPRPLSCCAGQWFEETKAQLRQWAVGPAPDSAVALSWDARTGELSRAAAADAPQLSALARSLENFANPADLDRNLARLLGVLPSKVK